MIYYWVTEQALRATFLYCQRREKKKRRAGTIPFWLDTPIFFSALLSFLSPQWRMKNRLGFPPASTVPPNALTFPTVRPLFPIFLGLLRVLHPFSPLR